MESEKFKYHFDEAILEATILFYILNFSLYPFLDTCQYRNNIEYLLIL